MNKKGFTLVELLVKLLVFLNSITCKESKPQAQLLRLALFFQINCFSSKPALLRNSRINYLINTHGTPYIIGTVLEFGD